MKTTVNKVLLSEKELIKSMTDLCFNVVEQGGSFEISNVFENTWFTVFKINFPDDSVPESLKEIAEHYNAKTLTELIIALKNRCDEHSEKIAKLSSKTQYIDITPYRFVKRPEANKEYD